MPLDEADLLVALIYSDSFLLTRMRDHRASDQTQLYPLPDGLDASHGCARKSAGLTRRIDRIVVQADGATAETGER